MRDRVRDTMPCDNCVELAVKLAKADEQRLAALRENNTASAKFKARGCRAAALPSRRRRIDMLPCWRVGVLACWRLHAARAQRLFLVLFLFLSLSLSLSSVCLSVRVRVFVRVRVLLSHASASASGAWARGRFWPRPVSTTPRTRVARAARPAAP